MRILHSKTASPSTILHYALPRWCASLRYLVI
jgi:hypothetical protein